MNPRQVTIIGGGLAGLGLGLALRQRDVPVTVIEAGLYPRHRVCGEFISGRGQGILRDLGVGPLLDRLGAKVASTAAFFAGRQRVGPRPLPMPATCVSRHGLDAGLAGLLTERGGAIRTGERRGGPWNVEGTVRATGRRPESGDCRWRWLGLKAHAVGVGLEADLELHSLANGYVGLCGVEGGAVNVCGLFRHRGSIPDMAERWREWLSGPAGSVLRQRLSGAAWDAGSFSAVTALSLRPWREADPDTLRIGDALGMIPPVTGNGMSIALESAALAAGPVADWSHGRKSWDAAREETARRCGAAFRSRLAWAAGLQGLLLHPVGSRALAFGSRFWPGSIDLWFHRTR